MHKPKQPSGNAGDSEAAGCCLPGHSYWSPEGQDYEEQGQITSSFQALAAITEAGQIKLRARFQPIIQGEVEILRFV